MSYTLKNAVKGIYPSLEIEFTKVLVCQGNLLGAENASAVSTTANTIEFSWDNNSAEYGQMQQIKWFWWFIVQPLKNMHL